MRNASWILCVGSLLVACHSDGFEGDGVLQDEASDEVLVTLIDAVERGIVTIDDGLSAQLVAPTSGAELGAGTPATFSWDPAALTLFHGRNTGDFIWLRIECSGMEPIDVLSIETMEYTPDAEHWGKITAAGGACTATLTTSFVDRGIIAEGGPFRPTVTPTFSISAQ